MSELLFTRDAARAVDAELVARGVPSIVLMENAGRGAADLLVARFASRLARPVVVGGIGQNGGDAWVVARQLVKRGLAPSVWLVGERAKLRGDAVLAASAAEAVGVSIRSVRDEADLAALETALETATVIVDGLFGTGLDRPLEGLVRAVVNALGASGAPVLALDVPSGVCADTGRVLGVAVAAEVTATFHVSKRGLQQFPGAGLAGDVVVIDIGVPAPPATLPLGSSGHAELVGAEDLARSVKRRPADAHKGTGGHVLVVAGSPGKTGAALLAGRGAIRAGAGLVTLAARGAARAALDAKVIELMTRDVPEALEAGVAVVLAEAASKSSAVVGPGLGLDDVAKSFVRRIALELAIPAVLDADALTAFASPSGDDVSALARAARARVLTPHPAEAARLLGTSVDAVQADRFAAATKLAKLCAHVVVLKGARTIVAAPDARVVVCSAGTPALGVAGTGDVLAGVIAARLAERGNGAERDAFTAAWEGVVAHALAGERAAGGRDRGLLASEVADAVAWVLSGSRARPYDHE